MGTDIKPIVKKMDDIFRMLWKKLRRDNKELFQSESAIKDSAIFKAFPLHKLTEEQEEVKKIFWSGNE